MKSIINNNKKEYIINKSRFICNMIYINDIEDVNKYLLEIKNKYIRSNKLFSLIEINKENDAAININPPNI